MQKTFSLSSSDSNVAGDITVLLRMLLYVHIFGK